MNSLLQRAALAWLTTALLLTASAAGAADLAFTPATTVKIENAKGAFDFLRVDTKRNRLLAAHEKDGTWDAIDLKTHAVLAHIRVGAVVDTAPDPQSRYYYLSVQEPGRVAVVDADTLKEVKSIKTAGPTDAIIYEPKNQRVYVTHDDGAEVWIIDPAAGKVVGEVAIPGVPEYMVYDPKADRIYLNIKDKDVVAVIDPASNTVVKQWPTAPARSPHGMAFDPTTDRIFVAGGNGKLVALDTRTGANVGGADIAKGVDQNAIDPDSGVVYNAAPGEMTAVTTRGKLAPAGSFATAPSSKNVTVDPATHEIWTTYTDGKDSYARSWRAAR